MVFCNSNFDISFLANILRFQPVDLLTFDASSPVIVWHVDRATFGGRAVLAWPLWHLTFQSEESVSEYLLDLGLAIETVLQRFQFLVKRSLRTGFSGAGLEKVDSLKKKTKKIIGR